MTLTNKSFITSARQKDSKRIEEKSDGSKKGHGMALKLSPSFYPTKMYTFHYKKQKALG
jgi:hypothetical protein